MSFRYNNAGSEINAGVCVIGGGPAGATIARKLALLGHSVCLIEKAENSQNKVGESLPPNILVLLDALGLRGKIEAASFLRPDKAIVRWSDEAAFTKSSHGHSGFLVNRGRFDRILLEAAKEAGVNVIQPAQALRPLFDETRQWNIPVRCDSGSLKIKAKYLVEAAGKRSFFNQKRKRYSASTVALCAYWRNPRVESSATLVEAGREEWFWGAALPDGDFSAMVFIDAKRRRGNQDLESFYRARLAESTLLRGCLSGRLAGKVKGFDASGYIDAEPVNENLIKVGEACFSIDPLASQGVQAAMNSGLQGSFVVHTLLTRPENSKEAVQFYRNRQEETVARHHNLAAQFYAESLFYNTGAFWRKRSISKTSRHTVIPPVNPALSDKLYLKLSDAATLIDTPCIADDIITKTRALTHAALERPIAYLNNTAIALLLDSIPQGGTAAEITQAWLPFISAQESAGIINWLYSTGVLQPSSTD
ncbi:MAG TPA: tryptophan 7-halogenase [Pyrinomonadaceae bacterium]|jgi:flavin-dependent dehydrogenase